MTLTTEELLAIAQCCRNAAMMLEVADESEPDLSKRKRIQNANKGQADLLRKASKLALRGAR